VVLSKFQLWLSSVNDVEVTLIIEALTLSVIGERVMESFGLVGATVNKIKSWKSCSCSRYMSVWWRMVWQMFPMASIGRYYYHTCRWRGYTPLESMEWIGSCTRLLLKIRASLALSLKALTRIMRCGRGSRLWAHTVDFSVLEKWIAGCELIQLILVKWFLGILLRGQKEGMTPVSSICKIISLHATKLQL
jgi:hypothetical protein